MSTCKITQSYYFATKHIRPFNARQKGARSQVYYALRLAGPGGSTVTAEIGETAQVEVEAIVSALNTVGGFTLPADVKLVS